MLIHAGAFGLFMLGSLVGSVMFVIWLLDYTPQTNRDLNIVDLVYAVFSFISQCCICQIFWHLGDAEILTIRDSESYAEVVVQEFDEEAQLMTRIWRQFIRKSIVAEEERNIVPALRSSVVNEEEDV